jgi:hypothetical protein
MAVARSSAVYDEFIEFITSSPTLEQIAEYQLSEAAETRVDYLLEQNNSGEINADELAELDDYLRIEHLIRMAKIRAREKLTAA